MTTARARPRREFAVLIALQALALCGLVTLGGCQSKPKTAAARQQSWNPLPEGQPLALPGEESLAFAYTDWEFGRRDSMLGGAGNPYQTVAGEAVIRQREFLRTINGQPRNDSWTWARSTQVVTGR